MKEVTLLFREIDIQETIGEVPKLRFVVDVNIKKFSEVQFSMCKLIEYHSRWIFIVRRILVPLLWKGI
ncbi:MAG: hypothetical protein ACJ72J_13060 [Nitrososphaeraceae archaeon]